VLGTVDGWSNVSRSAKSLAVQAFVMVALVGGTTAFVSFNKKVTLSVDGEKRTVHTFAKTVGQLLERENVTLDAHDKVAPTASTELADGTTVAVRYGRLLRLNVDGEQREAWVTATSVEEALQQLNVRAEGAYVSASRSLPIGRKGLALDVRTARRVTILTEGDRRTVTTTQPTVALALKEAGIQLGKFDLVSVPLDSYPRQDTVISITRVNGKVVRKRVETPFPVKRIPDATHFEGWKDVVSKGVVGLKMVMYEMQTVGGQSKLTRVLSQQVLKQPKPEVVKVGTKRIPNTVAGADNLNWAALAKCESGGRPKALNPAGPYYGLYQFNARTWRAVGGQGVPTDASAAEQTYRAKLLFVRSGAGQWPVCGRKLFT
jgi:uncharacterized protein YabE (DUF348 family)